MKCSHLGHEQGNEDRSGCTEARVLFVHPQNQARAVQKVLVQPNPEHKHSRCKPIMDPDKVLSSTLDEARLVTSSCPGSRLMESGGAGFFLNLVDLNTYLNADPNLIF